MTSHGKRLDTVHVSISSILNGRVRPQYINLVVNEDVSRRANKSMFEALKRQGINILLRPNEGPHTKYFSTMCELEEPAFRVVTADDDIIYPQDWLERLLCVHGQHPRDVVCWWAKEVQIDNSSLRPYLDWPDVTNQHARFDHFALGVSGVLYPPSMVVALRDAGDQFRSCCPRADDVWLHAVALRSGHRIRQVTAQVTWPNHVPGTFETALKHANHLPDGNDRQIEATYQPSDLELLRREKRRPEAPVVEAK